MLPLENRIRTRYEFNKVRYLSNKLNLKYNSPLMFISYINVSNTTESKFGIVVSTKFDKSAVVRNRIKRIIREVLRINLARIPKGYWFVIQPKRLSLEKTYEEINTDFDNFLSKHPISS